MLTEREAEVLALLAQGYSNREIAQALYLSIHTVEYYATRIYQKLGVSNRTQAAREHGRLGLSEAARSEDGAAASRDIQVTIQLLQVLGFSAKNLWRSKIMPLTWIALATLGVPIIAAALFLAGAGSGDADAQYCFGEVIATPPAGSARMRVPSASPTPVPQDPPESVCFDSRAEADAYSRERGFQYCVPKVGEEAGVVAPEGTVGPGGLASEVPKLECFDTAEEALEYEQARPR